MPVCTAHRIERQPCDMMSFRHGRLLAGSKNCTARLPACRHCISWASSYAVKMESGYGLTMWST